MENTRFMQGMEQLKAIDGKGGENVIKSLEDIAPDLGKFIVEFAFGDIYTRQGLTTAERELITLLLLNLKLHYIYKKAPLYNLNEDIPEIILVNTVCCTQVQWEDFPKVLSSSCFFSIYSISLYQD